MKKKSRGPVVCFEDFFDKIYGIHVETQNHSGGRKVQYGLYRQNQERQNQNKKKRDCLCHCSY